MVVKFADAKKSSKIKDGYERVGVKELIGKTIEIVDVSFGEGLFGKTGYVYLSDGKMFMTSSKVLLDQLEKVIQPVIEKGETVEATIVWAIGRNGRRYLSFA